MASAPFEIVDGKPGSGKSLYQAKKVLALARRNWAWYEKGNPMRHIYSNMKFSKDFEDRFTCEETGERMIRYWRDIEELLVVYDSDIIFDEIALYLPAQDWALIPKEMRDFLSIYRHRGLEIYGNTQDIEMVNKQARRMLSNVYNCIKIIGNRDPSNTKPPIKRIWGIIMVRQVKGYKAGENTEKLVYHFPPEFFFIEKELVSMYDTSEEIELGKLPALKHIERACNDCNYTKVIHT